MNTNEHMTETAIGAGQTAAGAGAVLVAGQRLLALDAHRGLIMVLMAIDHASFFIARTHSQEFWGAALPVYPNALWFWMRWITHPCAPGFAFLMGVGMALLAASRASAGWTPQRIRRYFLSRGLLLIALQFFIEDPAWVLGVLTAAPGAFVGRGEMPGGGSMVMIHVGVLFALGAGMLFWSFFLRAASWIIGALGLAVVLVTQFAMTGPERVGELSSPLVRLLLIPGHTNSLQVLYPVIPWLGVSALGLLVGRGLLHDAKRTMRLAGWVSAALIVIFFAVRITKGFGNLNEVPSGWEGFLSVVKYPPSLAFLSITLGLNLLLVAQWRRLEAHLTNRGNPLLVFGQSALMFYLLHLWIYALLGLLFRSGTGLPQVFGMWLVGLAILYPICRRYRSFKGTRPATSVWRFF
jgi:uncharacterized membrane protein